MNIIPSVPEKRNEDYTKRSRKWRRKKFYKPFVLCFRPVAMDGQKGAKGEPVISCVKKGDKDVVVISSSLSSSPLPLNRDERYAQKKGKKNFSRLLKAVMFGTSLGKKMKKKKILQKLPESNGSLSPTIEKDSSPTKEKAVNPSMQQEFSKPEEEKIIGSVPNSLYSSCSSSISSTSRLSSKLNSAELKPKQEDSQESGEGLHGTNAGLYLILGSLLFLVLWGKACALLCTTACIFLAPRRNVGRNCSSREGDKCMGVDSEGYKKKVIVEGLLERNGNRGL